MNDMRIVERVVDRTDIKITARGVQVYYGDTHAIKDVDVDIQDKTVTAFIGPSGCGKSTFLRCLNRMNDTIDDLPGRGARSCSTARTSTTAAVDPVQLRARVGMVFQKPNPFPKSIYDNVAYGPRIHGLARNKAELDEIVEKSLRRARALGRGQGPPATRPAPACRAASSSACASPAPSPPSPRCC